MEKKSKCSAQKLGEVFACACTKLIQIFDCFKADFPINIFSINVNNNHLQLCCSQKKKMQKK